MSKPIDNLPNVLKDLVNKCVHQLGDVIQEESGTKVYHLIEGIRQEMVTYRKASAARKEQIISDLFVKLEKQSPENQHLVAHAFTLMLELINTCETAYRTYRLRESKALLNLKRQNNTLVYVLTAHPTEARTTPNIDLFHRIQEVALRILENSGEEEYLLSIIKHNLKLTWHMPLTYHEKPQIADEAKHLFSIILRQDIFDTLLRANRDLGNIRVRTWVGGDKDGHPGVDEKVMLTCLQLSRTHFIEIIKRLLKSLHVDIGYIESSELEEMYKELSQLLNQIKKISANDATRVKAFKAFLLKFSGAYTKVVGAPSPRLVKLNSVAELFPGLVVPIELREDSEIIQQALGSTKPIAIERMLLALKEICNGGSLRCYAQGMILSMCESYNDVANAMKLMKKTFGNIPTPVIPLFETADALENAPKIVRQMLENNQYCKLIKTNWNNHLEVMLGYSDSSKGMGVFASRLGIARAMRSLDMLITENGIVPVFFHGSGGSVDRGGGSLKEQTAWWPRSALQLYKATVQGEMVERNFSSPEVTLSGMNTILTNLDRVKSRKGLIKLNREVEKFADLVKDQYVQKIQDAQFFKMVELATPYSYLNVLKLGSRPTKRAKAATLDFRSIRAIPWVLCWTQTRTLFPTWWGIGTVWKQYQHDKKNCIRLQQAHNRSHLFASFVRTLGFTLSKVDLQIFKLYLRKSKLSLNEQDEAFKEFEQEYKWACQFVFAISGERNLLWFKPWLKDSITFRSSMIHPLNVLQIIGNQRHDESLVRKSVAGISSGMMTTG